MPGQESSDVQSMTQSMTEPEFLVTCEVKIAGETKLTANIGSSKGTHFYQLSQGEGEESHSLRGEWNDQSILDYIQGKAPGLAITLSMDGDEAQVHVRDGKLYDPATGGPIEPSDDSPLKPFLPALSSSRDFDWYTFNDYITCVGGYSAVGAGIGGAVGLGVGAFAGGVGAVPGGAAGTVIGGTLGTLGGAFACGMGGDRSMTNADLPLFDRFRPIPLAAPVISASNPSQFAGATVANKLGTAESAPSPTSNSSAFRVELQGIQVSQSVSAQISHAVQRAVLSELASTDIASAYSVRLRGDGAKGHLPDLVVDLSSNGG